MDALVVAYKLHANSRFLVRLGALQRYANIAGTAALDVDGMPLALRRARREHVSPFENADLRGVFDPCGPGSWVLEIVLRAVYLATHPLRDAIALSDRLARAFGSVCGRRLRRFDTAADYVNFPLTPSDTERFATTRARRDTFLVDPKDLDEVGGELCKPRLLEHRAPNLHVTGITIAAGNPIMGRVYVKSSELGLAGREAKRELEHAMWRRAGWDGSASVTRVEFQHRGAVLDEIGLRDPDHLEAALDATWQRDTQWLRMVCPTSSRLSRAPLDPRWAAVRETTFSHGAEPIERSRKHRGGAAPEHVLGATISRLAASGQLARLHLNISEHGEVLDADSFRAMSATVASQWVADTLKRLFGTAAADAAAHFASRSDPRAAALRLFLKIHGAISRFSSVDDREEDQ